MTEREKIARRLNELVFGPNDYKFVTLADTPMVAMIESLLRDAAERAWVGGKEACAKAWSVGIAIPPRQTLPADFPLIADSPLPASKP